MQLALSSASPLLLLLLWHHLAPHVLHVGSHDREWRLLGEIAVIEEKLLSSRSSLTLNNCQTWYVGEREGKREELEA